MRAWKPYRPIGWLVVGPVLAVTFLLAGLVAVGVWLCLPKWNRNVNLTPLCESCGYEEARHIACGCPGLHTGKWSPTEPVEWKKRRR